MKRLIIFFCSHVFNLFCYSIGISFNAHVNLKLFVSEFEPPKSIGNKQISKRRNMVYDLYKCVMKIFVEVGVI